jgi:uncharacterized membrane protein YdjX (TVP38/TMEM64 family)
MIRPPLMLLRLGVIAALTALTLVCIAQYVWPQAITQIFRELINAVGSLHGLGWPVFVLVMAIVAISGFLPASLVGVSAGVAYGAIFGFATASISILTGAAVAFLLSHSLLRPIIERKLRGRPQLSNVDGQIGSQRWRFVFLLRLSPVMPFAATSYALGLTSIALGEYMVGTLATLPSVMIYVLAGTAAKTGVSAWRTEENSIQFALLALGTLSTVIVVIKIARMLRCVEPALAPEQAEPDPISEAREFAARRNRRG